MKRGYVVLSFPSEQMAKEWMTWHDGAGEQVYFDHIETRGDNGVDVFDYDYKENVVKGTRYGDEVSTLRI